MRGTPQMGVFQQLARREKREGGLNSFMSVNISGTCHAELVSASFYVLMVRSRTKFGMTSNQWMHPCKSGDGSSISIL